jgi:hypothetical protein
MRHITVPEVVSPKSSKRKKEKGGKEDLSSFERKWGGNEPLEAVDGNERLQRSYWNRPWEMKENAGEFQLDGKRSNRRKRKWIVLVVTLDFEGAAQWPQSHQSSINHIHIHFYTIFTWFYTWVYT